MTDVKHRPTATAVNNDDYIVIQRANGGLGEEYRAKVSQIGSGNFADMAEFTSAGGAAANPGPVVINGKQGVSDGRKYVEMQSGETVTEAVGDIAPVYDLSLAGLAASVARSGAPMTVGGSRATNRGYGTELEWDAGLGLADGNYIAVTYIPASPLNISAIDRLLFEFSHSGNWMDTRLQIIVSSANDLVNTSRFNYTATKKPSNEALMVLKSNFTTFTGAGVNWANVARVDFRFTKHSTGNPNQAARMELRRMAVGMKTRPMILFTQDDNAVELYNAHVRNASLNLRADMFVTDYELPTEDNRLTTKCTIDQDKVLAAAGYRFMPHNIDHAAYSQVISSYSRVGDVVTLVVGPYGSNGNKPVSEIMPVAGEYVIIEESKAAQLNGRWAVDSITLGTPTTNSTIVITVAGASFDNSASSDGATLTVEKYVVERDIQLLQQQIVRSGLPTSKRYVAYTYGSNSRTIRNTMSRIGIQLARSTSGASTQQEYDVTIPVFQIARKFGIGGQSDRLLSLPTILLTTAATLQTAIDKLLLTGGVLSVFTHGDDISTANIDACYALIAQYRDSGQVDIVNMSELEAEINARRQ